MADKFKARFDKLCQRYFIFLLTRKSFAFPFGASYSTFFNCCYWSLKFRSWVTYSNCFHGWCDLLGSQLSPVISHLHCIGNHSTILHHAFPSGVGTSNTQCYLPWGSTPTKWLVCFLCYKFFNHHLYGSSLIRFGSSPSLDRNSTFSVWLLARISSTSSLGFSTSRDFWSHVASTLPRTLVTFVVLTMRWELHTSCKLISSHFSGLLLKGSLL